MKKSKRMIFYTLVLAGSAIAGCNTVQGVGQDIESVGAKTSEVAQDVRE